MNGQIELKSIAIGILLTVCLFLVIGASSQSKLTHPHCCCRYQLTVAESSNVYVMDSHTGRVWRKYQSKNDFFEMQIDTQPKQTANDR